MTYFHKRQSSKCISTVIKYAREIYFSIFCVVYLLHKKMKDQIRLRTIICTKSKSKYDELNKYH